MAVPDGVKLLFGTVGIYTAFIYYGLMQEEVLTFQGEGGVKFTQGWFLQTIEALANVVVGFLGRALIGGTPGLPLGLFAVTGATQVAAKYFTSASTMYGLAYPVATLAKSGKMVPVMAGSLLIGGATYTTREYLQVGAIVAGTGMVALAKKKSGGGNSTLGVAFILIALALDGVTGGTQKKLTAGVKAKGLKAQPYDMMAFTNLFMLLVAAAAAGAMGEIAPGAAYLAANPAILSSVLKFAACSALGQSFIFYTIANFDPLVCTTVTTTRKIFTVLLSIFTNNHAMNAQGWAGIALASLGILAEMQAKMSGGHGKKPAKKV